MLGTLTIKRIAFVSVFAALCVTPTQFAPAQEDEVRPIRNASVITPIYTLLAYRPQETAHLMDLDDELIIAQIASFTDVSQARLFIEFHSSIQLHGVRLRYDDTIHYIVYLGLYEDDDTARWAHESFAEENPKYLVSNFKRLRLGDLKPDILR